MKKIKKRTLDELRQVKTYGYVQPSSHSTLRKEIIKKRLIFLHQELKRIEELITINKKELSYGQ